MMQVISYTDITHAQSFRTYNPREPSLCGVFHHSAPLTAAVLSGYPSECTRLRDSVAEPSVPSESAGETTRHLSPVPRV